MFWCFMAAVLLPPIGLRLLAEEKDKNYAYFLGILVSLATVIAIFGPSLKDVLDEMDKSQLRGYREYRARVVNNNREMDQTYVKTR